MPTADAFLDVVARLISGQLANLHAPAERSQHWVVILDPLGEAVATIDGGELPPHEVLSSLVDKGADAAAYVTYVPGPPEYVLTQLALTDPPNSDLRRSRVERDAVSVRLGPWEYTV